MAKNLLMKMLCVAAVLFVSCFDANAKWEMLKSIRAPYCMHVSPKGTILVADYLFDGTGGIYRSEDGGETWTKTDAPDYTYGKFIDAGDYIIATGAKCRVARSSDDGKTWEITNYGSALEDIVTPAGRDATISYAAAMHNGRLYVGDFNGGGVLYSEDFGETWVRTNLESLQYESTDKSGKPSKNTETIYNLVSYKGELYTFGVYFVFKYDEAKDKWIVLRDDSNFMIQSAIYNDNLVCGRSIMNQTDEVEFIVTYDGEKWGELKRPEGMLDNNIRCLEAEDDFLYIGFQQSGFWYTDNNGESYTKLIDGLPSDYMFPEITQHIIDLAYDENYVYAVIYDTPFSDREIDGIYRIAKTELVGTGSNLDLSVDAPDVYSDGAYLYVGECTALTISDLSGRAVDAAVVDGKVDLQNLTPGVYIYNVVNNDKNATGKFIKK